MTLKACLLALSSGPNNNPDRTPISITAAQTVSGSELAQGIRELVEKVEPLLRTLPTSVQKDARGALAELRDAAALGTPDVSRLRRGLEALKHIMEHATGHVVATGVLALIGELT